EQRIELMDGEGLSETITEMREGVIDEIVAKNIPENAYAEQWNVAGLKEEVAQYLNLDLPIEEWVKEEGIAEDDIRERIAAAADAAAKERADRFGPDVMNYVERSVVLQTLDHLWREHIV
ncbi:preprotein translocase subunit SecA, partial [Mesorhizobium sp. M1C.F.Ca.ET.193.01.1.1]